MSATNGDQAHAPEALRRSLGLRSLTLAVVTSTIGSGWLFAPLYAARFAGPASLLAWLAGGAMTFALALVFAELGALVPSSGALAQIPLLSHGRWAGFIGGWCAWIAYLTLPTIEVLAMVQYMASSFPWLTTDGGQGQVSEKAFHAGDEIRKRQAYNGQRPGFRQEGMIRP